MAISLVKTLVGLEYTLYILTRLNYGLGSRSSIAIKQDVYQSKAHYDSNFLPIISLSPVIIDPNALTAIRALLQSNMQAAIAATEQYLIGAVQYYSGGDIVG